MFGDSRGGGFSGTGPRAPTQVPALSKVKCVASLWPFPVLAGRALGFGFPGSPALSWRVPVRVFCSLSWSVVLSFFFPPFSGDVPSTVPFFLLAANIAFQLPKGGTSGQTQGHRPKYRYRATVPRNGFFRCPTLRSIFYPLPSLCTRRSCITADDCALKCVGDVFAQYLVTGHFRLFSVSSGSGCLDTNTRKYMHCPISIVLFWFASGRTTGIAMVSAASAAITLPIGKARFSSYSPWSFWSQHRHHDVLPVD